MNFSWQIFAVVTPLLFVVYQSLSKLLPKDLSVFLVSAYSSLMGAVIMFIIYLLSSGDKSVSISSKGLVLSLVIGTLIAFGNAGIMKAYGLGAPQSGFSLIYYPLLITYAIIFGFLFWGEKINWYQILGLLLILGGLFMVTRFKN